MKRLTKKIKGKQYARPFVVKDGYFWPLEIKWQEQINSLGDLKLTESMQDMQKRIYTALQVPVSLMGDEITRLGEAGIAGAKAAERLKLFLNKQDIK